MGIRLTDRDTALLLDLYDKTLLSYRQAWEWHFAGLARVTMLNRLTQLRDAGLISAYRAGILLYEMGRNEIGVVLRITPLGIAHLQRVMSHREFGRRPPPLIPTQLAHDLILGSVIHAIENKWKDGVRVVHGRHLGTLHIKNARVPDAVVFDGRSPDRALAAIELELTVKSERRYEQIVHEYEIGGRYLRLLYVYRNPLIIDKVSAAASGTPAKLARELRLPVPTFVRFAELSAVLARPEQTALAELLPPVSGGTSGGSRPPVESIGQSSIREGSL